MDACVSVAMTLALFEPSNPFQYGFRWGVSFDHWWWLLLIPLLGGGLWLATRGKLKQRWATTFLCLRLAVITLAAIALADPHWNWSTRALQVMLVRDASESVPPASQAALDRFLTVAGQPSAAKDESIGEITFGGNAVVRERPSARPLGPFASNGVDAAASNVANALLLARSVQTPDAGLRVVLASDGNETHDSLLRAAEALRARDIPVDVVPLPARRDPWAIIRHVSVPSRARPETSIQARVELESSRPMQAQLVVRNRIDGGPEETGNIIEERIPVELKGGRDVIALRLPVGSRSLERFDLRLETEEALQTPLEARRATAVTLIDRPSRGLIIAPPSVDPSPIIDALASDEFSVIAKTPATAPLSIEGWNEFDVVILAGILANDLGTQRLGQLEAYVEDLGGGLLVTGGRTGFARDWLTTALEPLLPVDVRLPESRRPSHGAVAFVIDSSGSMAAPVAGTGRRQQDLANDAAIAALASLSPSDMVTVIAFDGVPSIEVPLTRNEHPQAIAARIRGIEPGGGTDLFAAIDAAAAELKKAPFATRHIILLSDGNTGGDEVQGVHQAALRAAAGTTLSTISIGDSSADPLLGRLAHAGNGRFHRVSSNALARTLPEILKRETEAIRTAPIREGETYEIALVASDGPIRGLSSLPAITGYGITTDRGRTATVAARGPEGDPIIAFWNRGLGRVLAVTTDPLGSWGESWRSWEGFEPLVRQTVRWTARAAADPTARLLVERGESGLKAVLLLSRPNGDPVPYAEAVVRYVGIDGNAGERGQLRLEPDGPGRWSAPLFLERESVVVLNADYLMGSSDDPTAHLFTRGQTRSAFVHRTIHEWEHADWNEPLLLRAASAGGGVVHSLDQPTTLFLREGVRFPTWSRELWQLCAFLAALAFLADVACRRLLHPLVPLRREASNTSTPTTIAVPASNEPVAPLDAQSLSRSLDGRLARLQEAKRRATEAKRRTNAE